MFAPQMCVVVQTFVFYLFCKTTLILILSDLIPQNIHLLGFKSPKSLSPRLEPEELEQDNHMLEKQEFGLI